MLKSTLKLLGRDTILYGIAGSLQRLAPLFIVPILTRSLTQEEYGIYDTAIAAAMMLGGFAVVGQDNAVARFLHDDRSMAARSVVATSGFIIQFVAVIIFIGVIVLSGERIGSLLFVGKADLVTTWTLALWIVPGFSLFLFAQNLLKWTLMGKWYLALSGVFTGMSIGLAVVMIVALGLEVKGAVAAQISAYGTMALIGCFSVRKYIDFNRMTALRRNLVDMLRYGLPFVFVMVISNALPVIDRFFIVRFDTAANLGVYALGLKVAMLMMLVVSTFQIAFGPISLSMWEEEHAPATFRSLARIVMVGLGFFALLLAANGQILLIFLGGGGYGGAIFLLPFLCGAMVLTGLLSFTTLGIYKSKKSRYNLVVIVFGLVTALVSNALLVPLLGIVGAAMSAVMVQGAMNVCAYLLSTRYYESAIDIMDVIRTFGFLAIGMGVIYVGFLNSQSVLFKTLTFCTPFMFFVIGWLWVLKTDERGQIIEVLYGLLLRFKRPTS